MPLDNSRTLALPLIAVLARNPDASPARELEEIARLATQSLEEVREISQNLRPYQLDRLGHRDRR